jgi:hypothetical protein
MDKPKTPWPLHVQVLMQRTVKPLEDCLIFSGFWVDTNRVTKIMRSGAYDSFREMVKYCESQPGFLLEQLDEVADEMVNEMFDLVPPLVARKPNYQESVPAIREALRADLRAVLKQRAPVATDDSYPGSASDSGSESIAAKRRGRRPNQKRRESIRSAIEKHGEEWRDYLSEIFKELDAGNVPVGDFQLMEIDLGDGQKLKASKWEELDFAEKDQRKQIIDALRKYTD